MTCYVLTGSCPKTEAELREEIADTRQETEPVVAEWYRMTARRMRRLGQDAPLEPFGTTFLCERGRRKSEPVACSCGHLADLLCDGPIGRGRTCDAALCRCCRTSIGEDLDLCPTCVGRAELASFHAELDMAPSNLGGTDG